MTQLVGWDYDQVLKQFPRAGAAPTALKEQGLLGAQPMAQRFVRILHSPTRPPAPVAMERLPWVYRPHSNAREGRMAACAPRVPPIKSSPGVDGRNSLASRHTRRPSNRLSICGRAAIRMCRGPEAAGAARPQHPEAIGEQISPLVLYATETGTALTVAQVGVQRAGGTVMGGEGEGG